MMRRVLNYSLTFSSCCCFLVVVVDEEKKTKSETKTLLNSVIASRVPICVISEIGLSVKNFNA